METVRNENWTKSAPLGIVVEVVEVVAVVEVVVVVAVVGVVVVVVVVEVVVVVTCSLPLLQLKIRTCKSKYMPSYYKSL